MKIFDYLEERKSKSEYTEQQEEAIRMFEKQKSSIRDIRKTDGFKEILAYLDRSVNACESRIRTGKSTEDKEKMFDKREMFIELKEFLIRLSS